MRIQDWGLIDYQAALAKQMALVEEAVAFRSSESKERRPQDGVLVFCTHPPIVTLGRATVPDDMSDWDGATLEVSRGGRATYHGPSQIIIYPIVDLERPPGGIAARDVHAYLRLLEDTTAQALVGLGLTGASPRVGKLGDNLLTGVWVGERKIASVGVAVRQWVAYHGVAVNIDDDPGAFRGIRPCGFEADVMTSVERELGRPCNRERVGEVFKRRFSAAFSISCRS